MEIDGFKSHQVVYFSFGNDLPSARWIAISEKVVAVMPTLEKEGKVRNSAGFDAY